METTVTLSALNLLPVSARRGRTHAPVSVAGPGHPASFPSLLDPHVYGGPVECFVDFSDNSTSRSRWATWYDMAVARAFRAVLIHWVAFSACWRRVRWHRRLLCCPCCQCFSAYQCRGACDSFQMTAPTVSVAKAVPLAIKTRPIELASARAHIRRSDNRRSARNSFCTCAHPQAASLQRQSGCPGCGLQMPLCLLISITTSSLARDDGTFATVGGFRLHTHTGFSGISSEQDH